MTVRTFPVRTARGDWKPQHANGRLAESTLADLVQGTALATGAASGFLHFVKMWVEDPTPITNLHCHVFGAGATLTAGQCKGFIYNSAGTLLAQTADLATTLTTTGLKTLALTAESGQSLAVGGPNVWIHAGVLVNGTTMPTFTGHNLPVGSVSASHWALTDSTLWRWFRTTGSANTSVPATRPASGSLTEDTGREWWMAVS